MTAAHPELGPALWAAWRHARASRAELRAWQDARLRRLVRHAAIRFPWRKGDILLVDNFLVSHGRDPFKGPRRILVSMAELYTNTELG